MRQVLHVDHYGRKTLYAIPNDAPDHHATMGIFIGPPSLEKLNLPLEIEVRINNALFDRGIITQRDVERKPNEVNAAIQSALKIDAQAVAALYI